MVVKNIPYRSSTPPLGGTLTVVAVMPVYYITTDGFFDPKRISDGQTGTEIISSTQPLSRCSINPSVQTLSEGQQRGQSMNVYTAMDRCEGYTSAHCYNNIMYYTTFCFEFFFPGVSGFDILSRFVNIYILYTDITARSVILRTLLRDVGT